MATKPPCGPDTEQATINALLSRLRDGSEQERIAARRELASIFEGRGLLEEASECYEANITDGCNDPVAIRHLANLYVRRRLPHLANDLLAGHPAAPSPRADVPADTAGERPPDLLRILGLVADLVGVYGYFFFLKAQIDGSIQALRLPPRLDFYFLWFWAGFAAIAGGLAWNLANRAMSRSAPAREATHLGGTDSEPHGRDAVLWAFLTTLPVLLTLITLNLAYSFTPIPIQLGEYVGCLAGAIAGAKLFYDIPLGSHVGVRSYVEARLRSFHLVEVLLVLAWSLILGIPCFVGAAAGAAATSWLFALPHLDPLRVVARIMSQVGISSILNLLAVGAVLLGLPGGQRYEKPRGIVAGISLRMALFFALLDGAVSIPGLPR